MRTLTNTSRILLAISAAALVSACADTNYASRQTIDPNFGNAVNHNIARHVINPDPPSANDTDLTYNGRRVQRAVDRYEVGTVIAPKEVSTTGGGK